MYLKVFSQSFDGANTRNLMALLNTADMPSACCKKHVFLSQSPSCAYLLQRTSKVGLGSDILSGGHTPDFRPMGPIRPRPTSLIDMLFRLNLFPAAKQSLISCNAFGKTWEDDNVRRDAYHDGVRDQVARTFQRYTIFWKLRCL